MKKQQNGSQPLKGTSLANSSAKRKLTEKSDHLPKKPKTVPESIIGLKAETKKTVTPLGPGKGKGLIKGPTPIVEKPPILLREDSKYVLEKLSSIITFNDYKDLSNHATKAMGETVLFCIAQVAISVPFLFLFPSACLITNPFVFPGNVDDEGVNGPLPEPRDGIEPY